MARASGARTISPCISECTREDDDARRCEAENSSAESSSSAANTPKKPPYSPPYAPETSARVELVHQANVFVISSSLTNEESRAPSSLESVRGALIAELEPDAPSAAEWLFELTGPDDVPFGRCAKTRIE
jgi:hypothetical protein